MTMRDDFLGPSWAESHHIWANSVADAITWLAGLPLALRRGTNGQRVAIGLACVHKDSSRKEA
ncbi:hypothetical protein SAMN06295912_110135 [Sphingomonas laterariae]|uniref:Uncharacterized protein n=1 Tax=Edaphosphingomonas laterariae TaxID=861865 RepID=A0A239G0M8_9SPHN|nr:hypothetical protein [Sphingomonas laterariae]SNS62711.1 hypothetical protein SAMN06295912_110135 [Sphingomonas laterariae]